MWWFLMEHFTILMKKRGLLGNQAQLKHQVLFSLVFQLQLNQGEQFTFEKLRSNKMLSGSWLKKINLNHSTKRNDDKKNISLELNHKIDTTAGKNPHKNKSLHPYPTSGKL